MFKKNANVSFKIGNIEKSGNILHVLAAGEKPTDYLASLVAKDVTLLAERCFDENAGPERVESYLIRTKRSKGIPAQLYWLTKENLCCVKTIVRQYGLLAPNNWGDDCFKHLFLQNRFWNRLVEIEQDYRNKYREIIGSDNEVAHIQKDINELKEQIVAMDEQRKQLKILHRKKISMYTEPLDEAIKVAKARIKELGVQAKIARSSAQERIKAASSVLKELEEQRRISVKQAYNSSGLWWGNYNAVLDSYNTARNRAMKEGAELNFHRFDGSGRFSCQILGGVSTADFLSGKITVAQVRKITSGEFTDVIKSNPPTLQSQSFGSRRNMREYGILSITVYTGKDEKGKKLRRGLNFPIIMHRPLPENAALKMITVSRKKIGIDFRWFATFTFTIESNEVVGHHYSQSCRINFGWKQVNGGLRVATINDGVEIHNIILPQVIIDKLAYAERLQSQIDITTNKNYEWVLGLKANFPEVLIEDAAALCRAKRPQPIQFARFVIKWQNECPDFEPQALCNAIEMRKRVKRLCQEHHHLRDKVLRRRTDFYRNEAKKIADNFSLIMMDKIGLRQMAVSEKENGMPNELSKRAQYNRRCAAISEFREWIGKQAIKSGSTIEMININFTRKCSDCGGLIGPSDVLTKCCQNCGSLLERDESTVPSSQADEL